MTKAEKPTKAQHRVLARAVSNGGTIQRGGLDDDRLSRVAVLNCYERGWLQIMGGGLTYAEFAITDAGRAIMAPSCFQASEPRKD
jgi:hypothetical protein